MAISRRKFIATAAIGLPVLSAPGPLLAQAGPGRYVRFELGGSARYGQLDGQTVHELRGSFLDSVSRTGAKHRLKDVKLLVPCEPTKVLAVGFNYRSHAGGRTIPENPDLFFKAVTSLLDPEGTIVIPPGTQDCHYEGELVVVIGKKVTKASISEARDAIFGVTCGNDVSARDWQSNDLQWWRAKGSDGFGPLGPAIARGIDYNNLQLVTRLNGAVKQKQTTADLVFNVETIVSFTSNHVTLMPGDVIFTGTPGSTSAMKPGDVAEVEIEGVGVLRNPIG